MFFSQKIKVTFIDFSSGAVIGTTKIEPDQLPESFPHGSTLHFGDQEWRVEKADPPTRSQYAQTRKLVLTLAPAGTAATDPEDLLFSLPTIWHEWPAEDVEADGSEIVFHEDHWRQIEFFHESFHDVVAGELKAVEHIHASSREGAGFREIHVRTQPKHPLDGSTLTADSLLSLEFDVTVPIRCDGHGVRIKGGFACRLPAGWFLYGAATNQRVEALGILVDDGALPQATVAALESLAAAHDLLLVDWCQCQIGKPGDESFNQVLARIA